MFVEMNNYLWFNMKSLECNVNYELIGILLGLALYNGTILNLRFPDVIYKKLKKFSNQQQIEDYQTIYDIKQFDEDAFNFLNNILKQNVDNYEFPMYFSTSYDFYGEIKTIDLIENGQKIQVTE